MMKRFCLFLAIPMMFLFSGCCPRYQVFDLMEMDNHHDSSVPEGSETVNNVKDESYIQRVLVDTKTGKIFYFKNSQYLETVNP